jgi:hypothetical protein
MNAQRNRLPIRMPRVASYHVYAILALGLLLAVVIGEPLLYRCGMAALCVLSALAFRYDDAGHVALATVNEYLRRVRASRR